MFLEQTALRFRVEKIFEQPVRAIAAQAEAEMLSRHFGHGVRFIEHDKIIGKQHATRAAFFCGTACIEMGEE